VVFLLLGVVSLLGSPSLSFDQLDLSLSLIIVIIFGFFGAVIERELKEEE